MLQLSKMSSQISQRNSWILVLSQFLSACFFMIPIWIPFYQERISVEQISFLVAYQYAIQLFLELPTGALADLVGRKWTVILGYAALAISNLFIVYSASFEFIFIGATLVGLSEALISGALEALAYDSYKQDNVEHKFAQLMAKNGFWYQIGLAVGTLSGGFLYKLNPAAPYLLHTFFTFGSIGISYWFIEPTLDTVQFTVRNYFRQIQEGTREAFKSQTVALMSLYYIAVAGITWTNQLYFNSFMLVELGFTPEERSLIGGAQRLVNIFILRGLLKNERIFNRTRSIFFFPLMMVACYLPGILYQGWWALPLVTGALMAGTARWIVLTPLTNEFFESKYRATAISALSMMIAIIFIAITFVSGPIIEHGGGVRMMYSLLGVMTLVTVLPLSLVVARKKVA
jgi:MFS family permease